MSAPPDGRPFPPPWPSPAGPAWFRQYTMRELLAVVATLLAVAAVLIPARAASAADPACRVDYTVNQWGGGFTASVTVTELGPAVSAWDLRWTFAAGQRVTSAWNAAVTQSGTSVSAVNLPYNGSLPTGGSTSFGFQGTWTSANPVPADFSLNGVSCNGSGPSTPPVTPTPTPTVTPTPTPTPSVPAGCSGAVVCSGFEDQAGGTPSGDWQVVTPSCQGTGTATIDTATVHSGSRSLRVNGGGGYCNHVFAATTKTVSSTGPVVYARMWVRHTTTLPASHVTMITMADAANGNKDLRVGGQNGALQWNREFDDATLPEQSPTGVALSTPLATGRWVCLRYQIDTTKQAMSTYVDDQEVAGLHLDTTPTRDVDSQWLSRTTPPRPATLRLGWESYGGDADTLWFDDVAFGSAPIAC
ncbi:cellulose-binding domain-containing protein [Sphaerisporangium corydalis]|uniref:Cellulose-binding domain-containing protein n=1 Tax=Sphaerisporangium corydalis TaxID=1441875 RepID=A0ABV9EAL7_9ACTN|nr:cellulose-binding domain-containing protein [Sphaerisporangium corydalis]